MSEAGTPGGLGEAEPLRYTVRLSGIANRDAAGIVSDLEELTKSEETAREWYLGLRALIGTLATFPGRVPVLSAESRRLGREARRLLYRRPGSSVAHHVYYVVEDEQGQDGPRVVVFHIRNASRRPITPAEAKTLREDL